jgi:hypothetical protein
VSADNKKTVYELPRVLDYAYYYLIFYEVICLLHAKTTTAYEHWPSLAFAWIMASAKKLLRATFIQVSAQ